MIRLQSFAFARRRALIVCLLLAPLAGALAQPSPTPTPAPTPAPGLQNLGAPVNTEADEFGPSLTADGKTMVFNSRRGGEQYQNLYIAQFADGRWSEPAPLSVLNSPFNDETPFITPDGAMIFFASDRDGSLEMPADAQGRIRVSFDIYWSRRTPSGWSAPAPLPGGVNTAAHERAPALDLRNGRFFFSRWPFGDMGQSTVYQATYSSGTFGAIARLPAEINSGHQDTALTPAFDRPGYYFASRRPGGAGGWDVYYTEEQNGAFTAPENLGPEINTDQNDIYYVSVGGHVVLASNRPGGGGKYDLYAKLAPLTPRYEFLVRDSKTGAPLAARATVIFDGAPGVRAESGANGTFAAEPPAGSRRLRLQVERSGYLPYETEFDIAAVQSALEQPAADGIPFNALTRRDRETLQRTIDLVPIERGASFETRAIYFDFDQAVLKPESAPALEELLKFLRENAGARIEIIGHTDLHGGAEHNQRLSESRARAVRDFLVQRGVGAERLSVRGAGSSRPSVNATGPGADERNRRTEFVIQ